MSSRRDDRDMGDRNRDEELADLLDELGTTLDRLRESPEYRSRRFRPPTPREILRFTEEYTIPTVIAVLEANIRALELLGRLLRLADPERALREESDAARGRMDSVRRDAVDGLERAMSDLRTALSEADLPENPESRSIIEDARELTAEIESRIGESRRAAESRDGDRRRGSTGERGVSIAVDDEVGADDGDEERGASGGDGDGGANGNRRGSTDDGDGAFATGDDPGEAEERSRVDIDAELRSIKDEMRGVDEGEGQRSDEDAAGEDGDGGDGTDRS
ncbi:DUF7547 family protein [Halegenticoccus soli]|uniref:DUF7547 family protein n=1 Tax=Halegenticoccus soli TaxID=1985678 RepID=UPI001E323DF5|nr:hypothetical protein [Halegenticoccus soli]